MHIKVVQDWLPAGASGFFLCLHIQTLGPRLFCRKYNDNSVTAHLQLVLRFVMVEPYVNAAHASSQRGS
jgi:hypothetical protein